MRFRIVDCDDQTVATADEIGDAQEVKQALSDLHPWGRPFRVLEGDVGGST